MNANAAFIAEIAKAIDTAEDRGVRMLVRAAQQAPAGGQLFAYGVLEDHRVEVAGDLADALDRIEPGLGKRFMQAMYPELDHSMDADQALNQIVEALVASASIDRQPSAGAPGAPTGSTLQ